jgi:hypothetical protein
MTWRSGLLLVAQLLFCLPVYAFQDSRSNNTAQNPVSQRDIDRLRRQIEDEDRSNLDISHQYHTETGDLNTRLDYLRFGLRANVVSRPGSLIHIGVTQTLYHSIDGFLTEWGTNLSGGYRGQTSEKLKVEAELGLSRFSTDTTTLTGSVSIEARQSDRWTTGITVSRGNVEESLLSVAGIRPSMGPFAGQLVGRVMDDRVAGKVNFQPLPKLEFFGKGGVGRRKGLHVDSNFFSHVDGGAAYNIVSRSEDEPLTFLRASYIAQYYGFADDRSGFGAVSLLTDRGAPVPLSEIGGDGISPNPSGNHAGVGGYFSPGHFVSAVLRADLRGRITPEAAYEAAVFIGSQSFTGAPRHKAGGISGTLSFRLTDRYALPVTFMRETFGPFTIQSLNARLVVRL